MKKILIFIALALLINPLLVIAEQENDFELKYCNVSSNNKNVNQNIIIELQFDGQLNNKTEKNKVKLYELYELDTNNDLTRVNIAVNSKRVGKNDVYQTRVFIEPEKKLKPLTNYQLVLKGTNNDLKINFKTRKNQHYYSYYLILALAILLIIHIIKVKRIKV